METTHYSWNRWADLLQVYQNTEVLARYENQFYKGNAVVAKRKIGKGSERRFLHGS